ncbi:hypothetical protein HYPSUDRAFT_209278 [Hypholoma sublateritium FD-334 SS-4]|uniref:Uncharacterized protein n=1 Tax=Hypholoma sublateritium (strain FD-334 SS-4) TaxID=945553 RepID=A0A0D2NB10_HYPSF|nr:hypothetical protein HYPSUDRAFT_209278 [Hypholoma sublateritium FD-334 SS-4]
MIKAHLDGIRDEAHTEPNTVYGTTDASVPAEKKYQALVGFTLFQGDERVDSARYVSGKVPGCTRIVIFADHITSAKKALDPSVHSGQGHSLAVCHALLVWFAADPLNTLEFYDCPSKAEWDVHHEVHQFLLGLPPVPGLWPRMTLHLLRKYATDRCNTEWRQLFFRNPTFAGWQFLQLLDLDNNFIKPSYLKGGSWIPAAKASTSLVSRMTQAILGHAPIGEYYSQFLPDEDRACPCGEAALETRDHILNHCHRRGVDYFYGLARMLPALIRFLKHFPWAFSFRPKAQQSWLDGALQDSQQPCISSASRTHDTYSTPVPSSRAPSRGGTAVPSCSATPQQTEFSPLPSKSPANMGSYGTTPDPEDPESPDEESGGKVPAVNPFIVESMPHPIVLRGADAPWGDRQQSYLAAHQLIQQITDWLLAEGAKSVVATQSSDPYTMQAAVGALARVVAVVPWSNPVPAVAPSPACIDTDNNRPPTPTPKRSAASLGETGGAPKLRAMPPGPACPPKIPRVDPPGPAGGYATMLEMTWVPVLILDPAPQRPQPRPQPKKPMIPHQPPPLNLATKPRKS